MRIMSEETRLFVQKFISRPKQVGSIVPSSKFLAASMVSSVPWEEVRSVAELGSGTGAITSSIANKVRPDAKVYLFEKDLKMRKRLKMEYPDFQCAANVANMSRILAADGTEQLDCILSCLPFYNFPQQLRDRLIDQIVEGLKPGSLFIAFQYSLQMRKQLSRRFTIERIKFVPVNFPPAFVYVCRKKP